MTRMRTNATPRENTAAVVIFVSASVIAAFAVFKSGDHEWGRRALALGSVFLFLAAASFAGFRCRWGYRFGLAASLMAVSWCVWVELGMPSTVNSWNILNMVEQPTLPEIADDILAAKLRILSLLFNVTAMVCSSLRLLPPQLLVQGRPLRERTWPAFAVGILMTAVWFIHSAIPYRDPLIVHGMRPELQILYVQKRGLHFYEVRIDAFEGGVVLVQQNRRRLFQYRFKARISRSTMSPELSRRIRDFERSAELQSPQGASVVKPLTSWNADAWYLIVGSDRHASFTSENQGAIPQGVMAVFRELQALQVVDERAQPVKDICMGFCYSPISMRWE